MEAMPVLTVKGVMKRCSAISSLVSPVATRANTARRVPRRRGPTPWEAGSAVEYPDGFAVRV